MLTQVNQSGRNRDPAFNSPQVAGYIKKLKTRIENLADKDNKSLLVNDALTYCIKPACRNALQSDQQLNQLWQGGPQRRDGTQLGSPQYSWFLHAAASEVVSMWIEANVDDIFGQSGPLREKFERGKAAFQQAHPGDGKGLMNYIKRTFSRPIKTNYISII